MKKKIEKIEKMEAKTTTATMTTTTCTQRDEQRVLKEKSDRTKYEAMHGWTECNRNTGY